MKTSFLDNKKINSFLLALIISINYISSVIGEFLNISNLTVIASLIALLVSIVINGIKINKPLVLITIYVLGGFTYSFIFFGVNNFVLEYLLWFLLFGLIASYISISEFDYYKVIEFIILIYIFLSWFLIAYDFEEASGGERMGWSYALLPFILAFISYLINNLKPKFLNFKNLLYVLGFIIYANSFLTISSRGAILAVLIYVFLVIFVYARNKIRKTFYMIFSIFILFIIYINYEGILISIKVFLNSFKIQSNFVDKTLRLIQEDNLLHGREAIYNMAIDQIQQHPFTGYGIGSFGSISNGGYPHNFILQIIFENGILYLLPFLIILSFSLYIIVFSKLSKKNSLILALLFSIAIPKLLFSYEYWREQTFWILIFLTLNILLKNKIFKLGDR